MMHTAQLHIDRGRCYVWEDYTYLVEHRVSGQIRMNLEQCPLRLRVYQIQYSQENMDWLHGPYRAAWERTL